MEAANLIGPSASTQYPAPKTIGESASELPVPVSSENSKRLDAASRGQSPAAASRPSVFSDGGGSRASSSAPPSSSAKQETAIASAKDLPALRPDEAVPSSPQPLNPTTVPSGAGEIRQQPTRTGEPVFNPEEQPQAPMRQPHTVTVVAGTSLVVRLGEALSTDRNVTGDSFRGTLDSPIVLYGFIIADRGSKIRGRVANSQKAGHVDGLSTIALTLTEISTTDGQTVRVKTSNWEKQGEKSVGSDAAKIGAGAALGAIIGAIAGGGKGAAIGAASGGAAGTGVVLATRGKSTVLPVETVVTFRLDDSVSITEQINN
jgi:hypothetical protein